MYNKNFLFGFALLLFIVIPVVADIDQYNINYNIPFAVQIPTIIVWSNSKTQDSSLNININTDEAVKFNVTANQGIDSWQWSKDGLIQINNYDNYTTSWSTTGNKIISINGTNINGTTNTITWNINVNQLNQTTLFACGTLNKANTVYVLNSTVSSNGTCFTIGANNITLEGKGNNVNYAITTTGYGISDAGGYDNINIRNLTISQQNAAVTNSHGIYLRNVINSGIDHININTKNNAEGLYLSSSSSNIFSNIAINTINNGAYGIYLATGSNSNSFSGCTVTTAGSNSDGIFLTSSNSNSFSCNVNTTGGNGDGIYLASSNYNSYSGSIATSGTGANGIWINTNSNYNNFSNMNILASASGARISSANSNIIRDGSIISKLGNDYYLQSSPSNNNFVNTNFTTRKIYFADNNSTFNYANNNVALNTNQIVSPTKVLTVTRKLLSWSQTNVSWQETVSAARTLNYGIGGLMPNTLYTVWNGSIIGYNLTTNNNGNLPNFGINLTTTVKVIKVVPS